MQPCSLAARHSTPKPLTVEWHHVVPRAWQRFWTPPGATVVNDPAYGPMWDPRGVWVCPTHHRNIHFCIVALMHGTKPLGSPAERKTAQLALDRFVAAGGSLDGLRAAHEWGEA
jgi:hypothetical protein